MHERMTAYITKVLSQIIFYNQSDLRLYFYHYIHLYIHMLS